MTYNATMNHVQLIDMLHPGYNYTIKMAAVTMAGISPFTAPLTITTPEDGMLCLCLLFLQCIAIA